MLQPINLVIGIAWIVAGLIGFALSLPLIARRIGPNALYGVRFRQAFASDEAWFSINEFGGRRLAWWSLVQIACGVAALFFPLSEHSLWAVVVGVAPMAFLFIPMWQTWRFARRGQNSPLEKRQGTD